MQHDTRRALHPHGARPALEMPVLGLGGAPLGDIYEQLAELPALDTVRAALDAGISLFDTSPLYGHGLSEHRFGTLLRGAPREHFVLSTKVGRRLRPAANGAVERGNFAGGLSFHADYDYSYDGAMRSVEDSLQRLGLGRLDVLLIHDVDVWTHGSREAADARFREAMDGAYKALDALRSEGTVQAIGVGINEADMCARFANAGDFDVMLMAGRYTLLEQGAIDTFLSVAAERKVGIMLGGPFNSGILATGAGAPGAKYNYQSAPPPVIDKVRALEAVCERHGVALAAAALQFPLACEQIVSVVPGAVSRSEVEQIVAWMNADIPADLWRELKAEGLLRDDAPVFGD